MPEFMAVVLDTAACDHSCQFPTPRYIVAACYFVQFFSRSEPPADDETDSAIGVFFRRSLPAARSDRARAVF